MMDMYLTLGGVGVEKDDFISAVNSACGSLGEFTGNKNKEEEEEEEGFPLISSPFIHVVITLLPLLSLSLCECMYIYLSLLNVCNVIGPFIGGMLEEYMPQRDEVSCEISERIEDCATGGWVRVRVERRRRRRRG